MLLELPMAAARAVTMGGMAAAIVSGITTSEASLKQIVERFLAIFQHV